MLKYKIGILEQESFNNDHLFFLIPLIKVIKPGKSGDMVTRIGKELY
jgi:hypothetical protein